MEMATSQMLFTLLRSALTGEKITERERECFLPYIPYVLLNTAYKHDLIHLAVFGLKQNDLLKGENVALEKYIFNAVYRCMQLESEYDNLCKMLEDMKVPFLPLKGSVIRQYYPEAWMRTSSDIDILVSKNDIKKIISVLSEKKGYRYEYESSYDVSVVAPNDMHIELHLDFAESEITDKSSKILKDIWKWASLKEGASYWYELSDEAYYFYHIVHMAKHFEHGGCGIRPFIDLWILDNIKDCDQEKRNAIIDEGGLLKFSEKARKLKDFWFENKECDQVTEWMANYILCGGVYGNRDNRIALQQEKNGGIVKYTLKKIFVPYKILKEHYPIICKYRWLTPFMEIRRWCKLIFCGHTKRVMDDFKYSQYVAKNESETMKEFLLDTGLKTK